MNYRMKNKGMTLVELMVVVGIIAILAGILAIYVVGNRNKNAQVDMFNELNSLFLAQRMRASSLGLATYIEFDNAAPNTIQPKIGKSNSCTTVDDDRLPIRYVGNDATEVAIDVKGTQNFRTLDSMSSNRYIDKDVALTAVNVTVRRAAEDGAVAEFAADNNFRVICFQPNGQIGFISNGQIDPDITDVRVTINGAANANVSVGGAYLITMTGLGMIYTEIAVN